MHLAKHLFDLGSQLRSKHHRLPPTNLAIIQCSLRDIAAQHILQTHGLSAKLKRIACVFSWSPTLILYGVGLPETVLPRQRNAGGSPAVLQYVASPGHPQLRRIHIGTACDKAIPTTLLKFWIMGVFMEQCPIYRAVVFCPLVFDVDQCPLTPAKRKMLQSGELEEILLRINHPMRL